MTAIGHRLKITVLDTYVLILEGRLTQEDHRADAQPQWWL